MRRLLHWVAQLYPRAWRDRYGDEMEALLEQLEPSLAAGWDLALGALKMQLRKSSVQITLAFGLLGIALAGGLIWWMPPRYISEATLIQQGGADQAALAKLLDSVMPRVLSRRALSTAIQELDLYAEQRKVEPLEDVIETMRRAISVSQMTGGAGLIVRFVYPQQQKAQAVVDDLVRRLLEENLRSGRAQSLELLDPPTYPHSPIFPNWRALFATGLAAGLVVGAAIARWRALRAG